ncbi:MULTISPECIES: glycoside hydrolase family 130 protein [Zobellia]|uniref:Putative glycoside hydrolase n=1 Tax=Zobellia galactanivorans (strain DSM 12802 / CCUG 47099 / CIP 106680 / NCIMB 13871 / Dsij) TaxID=63186 RepID=G0L916_ZOBGA|nr:MULTISPECIES: glycosidase [Zobellia]MBU3028447.1 glycosidase [Zobellia galactanivorans]CAZ94304.1 Putative glycoside hydrolase [Zobellia galactanivorans]
MKLKKNPNNPILKPHPTNYWENLVVCNPGVWFENGKFTMLYRAAGDDEQHLIRMGRAESTDGIHFNRCSDEPAFEPSTDGPDKGGIEDPRIVKFGEEFYVTYAYRPHYPGQYWKFEHDVILLPDVGADAPAVLKQNIANSGLAVTKDFKDWMRLGRITDTNLDDRDVILFPEKINGKYAMLHRPKQWIGEKYGCEQPSIWIRFSEDLMVWNEPSTLLISGRKGTWEEKVGGSTPPLKTPEGWLIIYHGVENGGKGYYRVGLALLDLNDPTKVIARATDFVMEPEHDYEIDGPYQGCVFPTGNVIVDDTLYVYYGAADKYIGLATCKIDDVLDYLKKYRL